ncbi:MAG: ribonuclease D [Alphaproteobacteria bacterium]|nr:ribonuclease D [Alphaproteobacteria bacterium]
MKPVVRTNDLAAFCVAARSHPFVTIDTEFLRETTYWPKLCLVQLATDDDAILVDPLANGISLDPLFALLDDPTIVKVFHAARQDVEIFVNLTGRVPQNLFDTQVAASVCGYGDSASYDSLVHAIVGERIDKSSRFTDWSARPLSDKQMDYALADVTYLRDIYKKLVEEIAGNGRAEWVADENRTLQSIDTYVVKPEDAWRRVKARLNRPRDLAAVMALARWREQRAQDNNQPRGRVLKDDALAELAVQRPKSAAEFDQLRAVPKGYGRSAMGTEILAVLAEVEAIPKGELPHLAQRPNGPSPKGPIGDLIRVLLKSVAEREGVAARIIATSDDIDQIVLDDEADVAALTGWRRRVFGDKALAIKKGRLGLAATEDGVVEFAIDASMAQDEP